MKKMLFEPNLEGHRLEYIHHIYMGMVTHKDDTFIIVVPKSFETKKSLYYWPKTNNVCFKYLEKNIDTSKNDSLLRKSLTLSRILRKYVKNEDVQSVFLLCLMEYVPFLALFLPSRVRISGIIYTIYLYRWKDSPLKTKIKDIIKYQVLRFSKGVSGIYILNDASAAAKLNRLYHTDKFMYITDPFNAIDYKPTSIRESLHANDNDVVFLHFGGLSHRKGTLEILEAISLLPSEKRSRMVFVFAGKIYNAIHNTFYKLKDRLPQDVRIIVFDQFCPNTLLADLCVSSDFILMPYKSTSQSSGLLGYAASYGVPVIGPSSGLVGKLIRRNHLGTPLPSITPEAISNAMCTLTPYSIRSDYKEKLSVSCFINSIFEQF